MNKNFVHRKLGERTARPLRGHESAQAVIFTTYNGGEGLRSYNTVVIKIDPAGWLTVTGTYSQTTRRHIGWFMAEMCPDLGGYKTAKNLAETGDAVNVKTGERRPATAKNVA